MTARPDPDRPHDHEIPLAGGFVNDVVRVGDTVRRTSGPWTPAVHALLRHLEEVGFAESPRVLGIDDLGREVLSYLPGETMPWTNWPRVLCDDDGVAQLGRLLRRYHDAVSDFRPPPGAVWRNPLAGPGEIIRHGDFSPFNTTWVDDTVVGLIDWDFARPGRRIDDLAYLAWQLVPLQPEGRRKEYGLDSRLDLPGRLSVLCDAYGGDYSPAEVVAAAIDVIEAERGDTAELATWGLQPWVRFADDGSLQAFAAEARWLRRTRDFWAGNGGEVPCPD
ncbi:aminoglycoside phosphotransferase family protein [Microlunatus elymi]|uniref:Aminoglycoside phosphotransferase family protein n=1 Tax=Microlunatus elymi TaxID=2596828 RepID=A0A516PUN5_9ACTN|nr:aminoglycoside phosphotransferase family protein [Microlunatus elymi]QDP94914.1 aminoglycoside phosphotransferase family protein [Microlunatus elymi]